MSSTPGWNGFAEAQANRAKLLCPEIERSVGPGEVPDLSSSSVAVEIEDNAGQDDGEYSCGSDFGGRGVSVIFGNDGFLQNHKVRAEVRLLRQTLAMKGLEVLGFGISTVGHPSGKSWALVVASDDLRLLGTLLYAIHSAVFHRGSVLEAVAESELRSVGINVNGLDFRCLDASSDVLGPTNGNARLHFEISHYVSATSAAEAERKFVEALGEAVCRQVDVYGEQDREFSISARVYFDCDLEIPSGLGGESSLKALKHVYDQALHECGQRLRFDEIGDLEVEVLTDGGDVFNVTEQIVLMGGML